MFRLRPQEGVSAADFYERCCIFTSDYCIFIQYLWVNITESDCREGMSTVELRCKPGDVAIVSRCNNRSRIGVVVRVVSRHESGDFDWVVELLGGPIRGRGIRSGKVKAHRRAAAFDWNLTPLADQASSDREDHQYAVRADLQTP